MHESQRVSVVSRRESHRGPACDLGGDDWHMNCRQLTPAHEMRHMARKLVKRFVSRRRGLRSIWCGGREALTMCALLTLALLSTPALADVASKMPEKDHLDDYAILA